MAIHLTQCRVLNRLPSARQSNDEEFSKQLAALCDYYVNDAFGTAHRAHASTEGITKFVDRKVNMAFDPIKYPVVVTQCL